jgi:tetratricopeptide (TPR) repeat protein
MLDDRSSLARVAAEEARNRALLFLGKGEFPEALAAYDDALTSARAAEDDVFVDWIYACRAAAAAETGPAGDELVELKRILLRGRDAQTSFRAAYSAARIYELRRDFKRALFYSRIAEEHAGKLDDALAAVGCANQSGSLLAVDSRFEEAAAAYSRALSLGDGHPSISDIHRAVALDNLGYCRLSLDEVKEGLELVHGAFDTLERHGARSQTVVVLLDLCFGYLKANRYAEARYFGEEGLERSPLSGDASLEKNLLYLLGEACHLSGDDEAAAEYFDRLAALYPEFRNLRAYLEVFDFRNVINLRS